MAAALAVATLAAALWAGVWYRQMSRTRWARETGLPQIQQLAEREDYSRAFALAQDAQRILGDDRELAALWPRFSRTLNIDSIPDGATVRYRQFGGVTEPLQVLGETPTMRPAPAAPAFSCICSTCEAAGTCWESDHLEYVGTDGQRYSASIEQFQAATGTPTYAPSALLEAAPVTFSANDFEPGGSTGHLTYSWRFQPLGCGFLCFANTPFPRFDGPFTGESVSYTWQSNGRAWVELTASDPDGHSATTKFLVDVGNIAPTVVTLHEQQTVVGREVLVQGVVGDAGAEDDLNVAVTLGDGVQKAFKVGPTPSTSSIPTSPRSRSTTAPRCGAPSSGTPTPSRATTTAPTRCPTGAAAATSTPSSSGSSASRRSSSLPSRTTSTATRSP